MVYYLGVTAQQAAEFNKPGCAEYAAEKINRGDALVALVGKCGEEQLKAIKYSRQKSAVTLLCPTDEFEPCGDIYESSEIILLSEVTAAVCTGICPDCEVNLALAAKKLRNYGSTNIVITIEDICTAVIVGQEITLVPADEAVDSKLDINFVAAVANGLSAGKTLVDCVKREVFKVGVGCL